MLLSRVTAVCQRCIVLPGMTSFAQLNTTALMQSKGKNRKGQPIRKAAETRRAVWTSSMEKKYPLLCAIALRLLSMHATSCGSERNWSVWRFTCRDTRRRLALQKVCCLPSPHLHRRNTT